MRNIVVFVAGLALASCSGGSSFDLFKTTPPNVTVQLESVPPGADAVTSLGPGCKTPCSVSVPSTPNFTVTYSLARFEPTTVEVQVLTGGGEPVVNPNPVVGELVPAQPPKKAKKKSAPKAAAKPAAAAAPPPPATSSPFPPPR